MIDNEKGNKVIIKILYLKAWYISNFNKEKKALVIPHPGQYNPVSSKKIQGIFTSHS